MPEMTATVPHELGRDEAKRRIQAQLGTLRQQYGTMVADLRERWSGDVLDFSAQAAGHDIRGKLAVEERCVHLTVSLPWLLSVLMGTINRQIETHGREALGIAQETGGRRTKDLGEIR